MNTSKLERKLLHYTGKAIADYSMIETGDKILVCLSGGKDSLVLTYILWKLQWRTNHKFKIQVFILDQGLPNFDASKMQTWLEHNKVPYVIQKEDTYSIVKQKSKNNKHCMLCSRLRRGIIYSYARTNGFNKIALGHHRDDLITSLLMSIMYKGEISSMPPKLLTNDKTNIVIRPLCYCQEQDIKTYAETKGFPINAKNLCAAKENISRKYIGNLIKQLAEQNSKIPSNMLHSLQRVKISQLMDRSLWEF